MREVTDMADSQITVDYENEVDLMDGLDKEVTDVLKDAGGKTKDNVCSTLSTLDRRTLQITRVDLFTLCKSKLSSNGSDDIDESENTA